MRNLLKMPNAVYNDHIAALSVAGGLPRAILRFNMNPLRLAAAEFQSRTAPRFA